MNALRRAIYAQSLVWATVGLALAVAPRLVLDTVFGQAASPGAAWIRVVGLEAVGLAMLMVLVGHRLDQLWWWSWAFTFVTVGTAAVALLHAAFGLARGESAALWWTFGGFAVAFSLALLYGLYLTAREHEPG